MNDWINSFLAARFLPSLTFDWVDLGAGGGQDLYLMPLHFSSGTLLKIDGRETNFNSPSNDKFLNDYIDHTKVSQISIASYLSASGGLRYIYRVPDGGGSTFYPGQHLDVALVRGCTQPFLSEPVQTLPLSQILKENSLNPIFIKIDLEGAETDVFEDLFHNSYYPLLIEAETNVSPIAPGRPSCELLSFLDRSGYRLIDLRTTYDYCPISHAPNLERAIQQLPIWSSAFQGHLDQFDGLYIKTDLLQMPIRYSSLLPSVIYILVCYRQFHLASRLIEISGLPNDACIALNQFIDSLLTSSTALATHNPMSCVGYHPLTNWLKRT